MEHGLTIGPLSERQRTLAFMTIMLAFTIDVVDSTIVNTAIPTIQADLGVSGNAIQWVIAAYFLSFAVLLVTGGRLGDLFGYRRLFLLGVGSFTVASMACGLARSAEGLVAARLVQGATAAVMAPQVMALVQLLYGPLERVGRLAAFGIVGGLAAILGPVIGGLLIAMDPAGLGWRSIFLINAPLGIGAVIAGRHLLPTGRSPHPLRIDVAGTVLIFATLLLMLVPLIQGRELDWPWWCFAALALSGATAAIFWRHQRARSVETGSALIAPELFRDRGFSLGLLTTMLFATASTGFLLSFSLTLQSGLGYAPLEVALLHVPFGFGVMAGISQIGRKLLPRHGKRVPMAGGAIMAAGCLAASVAVGGNAPPIVIGLILLVAGTGMGVLAGPIPPITLARVDRGHAGVAGGTHKAVQQIGGALGGATIGTAFFAVVEHGRNAAAYRTAFPVAGGLCAGILIAAVIVLSQLPDVLFPESDRGRAATVSKSAG